MIGAMRANSRRGNRHQVYSLVVLLLVSVVAIVALSGMLHLAQRKVDVSIYSKPHETLRVLAEAEQRFRRVQERGAYAASLAELEEAGCITARLAEGDVQGYRYRVEGADARTFAISASPAAVTTASLFYYTDQTHVVRAAQGAPAGAESDVYWHPFGGLQWSPRRP